MSVLNRVLLSVCVCSAMSVWAAPQTTPYIAMHTSPLYANATHYPYANPNALKGGSLSLSGRDTFDTLNQFNGKGTAASGLNYLFDSLMDSSLDETGVMYPLLAESVTFDLDQFNYVIFHLNPKARFSDGTPVTAEDVKFTFEMLKEKASMGIQMYIGDLERAEVLSKHDVKFHFKTKGNKDLPMLLASMPIYSKQDWQGKDFARVTMKPILGSGAYVIDHIDAGRSIRYKRNPNYWAKDLMVNRGRHNFDTIKYVYYRNFETAFEGFKSGEYSMQIESSARRWVSDYAFPAVQAGLVKQYSIPHHNPINTQSFVMNSRKAPFDDYVFRKAMNYAYDFEWQSKALFYGQYRRLNSYFTNSELEAKGTPSAEEMAILKPLLPRLPKEMQEGVLSDWRYPVSDASGFNRDNLIKAYQMLKDAGYSFKNGQLHDKQGKPIRFEFLIQQENMTRVVLPFVRNLKKLGIQVDIRQVDMPQYLQRMRNYDFDMTTNVLLQSLSPGNEQAQYWGSASADQKGAYNYAG
ncbi:MAG: extracellular solute-binding protein, partial [Acinetobacter sp.]|nr:extracellular solute-binding protein [Acinetobacter sp.]